jgi:D-glycero-alpha-D-manno-heptose-7-phosphate kinase
MIIRSRAPLRLGLSGGGTDVSPYSEEYGGCTLSTTINMYAYCTIEPAENDRIEFIASDLSQKFESESRPFLKIDSLLPLHKGIYNRIVKDYLNDKPLSFRMVTYSDALPGSGLGSSSTMVVAIIHVFKEWLKLPLGDYDIAKLAFDIERNDLELKGGKQDQYSATFGGINFMEFLGGNKVIVNPLRVKQWIKNELEDSIVLVYTGQSRDSSRIIEEQIKNATLKHPFSLEAMHEVKRSSIRMKEAMLTGDLKGFVECMESGWKAKKNASSAITNKNLNGIYDFAIKNGAKAGKISGAGGGGFFMFFVDIVRKVEFVEAMRKKGLMVLTPKFVKNGSEAWQINSL